ncbi:MAG TPA: hypothetical protein VKU19_35800 [Bryobacteraceae bacterium]|nr:hypothetical protein [Bryobacteraceae bacterium]
MSDENCVNIGKTFADSLQSFAEFAHAEARIDEDAGFLRRDERGVAGTSACQNAKLNRDGSPEFLEYTK